MTTNDRRPSQAGHASISIDLRTRDVSNGDRQYYSPLGDLLVLLSVLEDLAGDDVDVFFDFGVITVTDVDLAKVRERIEAANVVAEPPPVEPPREAPPAAHEPPPAVDDEPAPTVDRVICTDCFRDFGSPHALTIHRSKSHRPPPDADTDYRCEECGQACTSRLMLDAHTKAIHPTSNGAAVCAVAGCSTVLSRFGKTDRCARHERDVMARPL